VGTVGDSLPSPADIGFDVGRSRVLIPIFSENGIVIHPVVVRGQENQESG
jgi:hypothetical protein